MLKLLKKTSKKAFFFLFVLFGVFGLINNTFAQNTTTTSEVKAEQTSQSEEYIFYYGEGCSHCAKVEKFFEETNADKKYGIIKKEIYSNFENQNELIDYADKLGLDTKNVGIPFLVINNKDECKYIAGDGDIISFFKAKLDQDKNTVCKLGEECPHLDCNKKNCEHISCQKDSLNKGNTNTITKPTNTKKPINTNKIKAGGYDFTTTANKWKFFITILPASLSDAVNPCLFAITLLLLATVFQKQKTKKAVLKSGFALSTAIFLGYLVMGLGLKAFLSSVTAGGGSYFMIGVGVLGILVGLANLKDFFRYKKGFVMEVPLARRPRMKKFIKGVTSPISAFLIGLVLTLFLLPCTMGPYAVVTGMMSRSILPISRTLSYLVVYCLFFVAPIVIITLLVAKSQENAQKIAQFKKAHEKNVHLIVGLLMIGLGLYVLLPLL